MVIMCSKSKNKEYFHCIYKFYAFVKSFKFDENNNIILYLMKVSVNFFLTTKT